MSSIEKMMRKIKRDDRSTASISSDRVVPVAPVADSVTAQRETLREVDITDTADVAELEVSEEASAEHAVAEETEAEQSDVEDARQGVVQEFPADSAQIDEHVEQVLVEEYDAESASVDTEDAGQASAEEFDAEQEPLEAYDPDPEAYREEGDERTYPGEDDYAPAAVDEIEEIELAEDQPPQYQDEEAVGDHQDTPSPAEADSPSESQLAFASFLRTHVGQIAEEYRRIKLPLLKNAFQSDYPINGHRNTMMITSSIPGEGKTFNALHLAISISMEKEKTVLLVDADLQMGKLSQTLGLRNRPGLSDYLFDRDTDLSDYICKTQIPNFSFIPAGLKREQTAELLSSKLMSKLTDELASRYDDRFIMLDSPPLLASSEARILAGLVGQVALVVEAESTPRATVEEAVKHLEANDVVGLVFNKCPKRSGAGYYDAYYGAK